MSTSRPSANTIFVDSQWVRADPRRLSEFRDWAIWSLGGLFAENEQIRQGTGGTVSIKAIGPRLTETLGRVSAELIDLDSRLGIDCADAAWRYSDVAERGPYNTDLMVNISRAITCLDIIRAGGKNVFIVDKPSFKRSLMEITTRAGFHVHVGNGPWRARLEGIFHGLSLRLRGIVSVLRGATDLMVRLYKIRNLRRSYPIQKEAIAEADTLILVWGQVGTFPEKGVIEKTEHFGELPKFLRANGRRVAFLVHPISWLGLFDRIATHAAKSEDPVLFVEDFFTLKDLVCAVFRRRSVKISKPLIVGGWDLSPILLLELKLEAAKWRPINSGLYARVAARLAKLGANLQTFVYGFENQSFEKALIDGFRATLPDVRLVAVQNALFAANYLCFYPSRDEIVRGLIPDLLVTTGEDARAMFAHRGFPPERMMPAAFRYDPVTLKTFRRTGSPSARPTILCATSIGHDEALELLLKTARALKDRPDLDLIVNFHPVTNDQFRTSLRRDLKVFVGDLRCGLQFSEAGIRELLPNVDVLVYNSSSSSFEALAAGVPIVFVGRDSTVDFDKVPADIGTRCWAPEELRSILDNLLTRPAQDRLPNGLTEAVTRWLAPATRDVVASWDKIARGQQL